MSSRCYAVSMNCIESSLFFDFFLQLQVSVQKSNRTKNNMTNGLITEDFTEMSMKLVCLQKFMEKLKANGQNVYFSVALFRKIPKKLEHSLKI